MKLSRRPDAYVRMGLGIRSKSLDDERACGVVEGKGRDMLASFKKRIAHSMAVEEDRRRLSVEKCSRCDVASKFLRR